LGQIVLNSGVSPGTRASLLRSYSIPSWKGLPRAAVSIEFTPTGSMLDKTHGRRNQPIRLLIEVLTDIF